MRRELPDTCYHVTPLHYAPYLLRSGCLYSQRRIRESGLPLTPRPSVERRDRKLGLDRFVHLSVEPITPLLTDKMQKQMPHVLVEFAGAVRERDGAAFVRYNAKAWRHRDDFLPVTEDAEKAALWTEWQAGRFPSVEILIPDALPLLPEARAVHVANAAEFLWLLRLIIGLALPTVPPVRLTPERFPSQPPPLDFTAWNEYADACLAAGHVLPPPAIPFD